ncbi:MAG TPA: hypothetical protein QF480_08720, partial [Bacteroidales bacterium]|nr:hypothetical protein [Bacteroidales bacterium]
FYFPGIVKHHSLKFYSGYQHRKTGNYSYSNFIRSPRGYTGISLKEMFSLKADYTFPIIYPDLDIQAVAYLKRVYAQLYYDHATGKNSNNQKQLYNSAGVEIYTDWHFLSLIPNFRLGLRSTYRFKDNQNVFEFLYGFSIN